MSYFLVFVMCGILGKKSWMENQTSWEEEVGGKLAFSELKANTHLCLAGLLL